jgi:hypothetical protein
MSVNMSALGAFLKGQEDSLPAAARKKVYKVVKYVGALSTLALLLLPALPGMGLDFSKASLVATVASALLFLTGQLADPNTRA